MKKYTVYVWTGIKDKASLGLYPGKKLDKAKANVAGTFTDFGEMAKCVSANETVDTAVGVWCEDDDNPEGFWFD